MPSRAASTARRSAPRSRVHYISGQHVNADQLFPDNGDKPFRFGVNAKSLLDLAHALGACGPRADVTLEFVMRDGVPQAARPITVTAPRSGAATAIIMPVRAV